MFAQRSQVAFSLCPPLAKASQPIAISAVHTGRSGRYSVFPREREQRFSSPSLSPCFPEDKLQPLQTQSSRPHFAILPPWHSLCGCSLSPQISPAVTPLGTGDAQSGDTLPKEATIALTTYHAALLLPFYVHGLLHRVRALPRSQPEVPAWLPPLSSPLRPCLELGSFSPYCSTLIGAFCPLNLPFHAHLKASAVAYPPPGPTLAASSLPFSTLPSPASKIHPLPRRLHSLLQLVPRFQYLW